MNIDVKIYPSSVNNSYDLISAEIRPKYNYLQVNTPKNWNFRVNQFFDFTADEDGVIFSFNYGDIIFKSGYYTYSFLTNYFDGFSFASPGTANPPFSKNDLSHAIKICKFISNKFQCYVEAKNYTDRNHHQDIAFYCGNQVALGSIPQDCLDNDYSITGGYLLKWQYNLTKLRSIIDI